MSNLTELQKLTAEIDSIMSQRVEIGHKQFAQGLVQLSKTEATRVDKLVSVKNMIPQPVSVYPIKFEYAEKSFQPAVDLKFNRHALSQYLSAREPALRVRVFDSLKKQTINTDGNRIDVDFKQNYLNQVRIDRSRMKRNCRINSGITTGFVGENYPLDWSDFQAIQGILNAARSKDVDLAFMPMRVTDSGTISTTILFPDLTYEENKSKFSELVKNMETTVKQGSWKGESFSIAHNVFGMNYSNNPNGKGSLRAGGTFYRGYCSNLAHVADSLSMIEVPHATTKSFYEGIIDHIKKTVGDEWYEEPLNVEIANCVHRGISLKKNPTMRRHFYELFGETVLQTARAGFQNFVKIADRAQSIEIKDFGQEIEAQARFYGLKNSIPLLKALATKDPTINTDEFSLWFMSQLVTRLANSPTISVDKSLELQDTGYSIMKGKALTALAV